MTYPLFVTHEARNETRDAYHWYENQLEDLGERFLDELQTCYGQLATNPLLYGFLDRSTVLRFMMLRKFPFAVIYLIHDHTVNIVSVRHTSRTPLIQ